VFVALAEREILREALYGLEQERLQGRLNTANDFERVFYRDVLNFGILAAVDLSVNEEEYRL
jgi:hypothetical protein